ncbi:MAG TPA: GTPase ObgE [Armatimonadota bacterium]
MFLDEARIEVAGGRGGNGALSFRREKYVPRGGPDGGDGGHGGSIIFVADQSLGTLVDFRYNRRHRAENGGHGLGSNKSGKDGADLTIKVPVGTAVYEEGSDQMLADLTLADQRVVIAPGGKGGRGNARFSSSSHQTPRYCEKGQPGVERLLRLELKLLADVGLVGFPNVGKSTLISRISAARPKIADYPFTTLVPNLGVVALEPGLSFVVADIPGIIEGASEGAGLGIRFLKHVERTRLLVHLLDVSGATGRDPLEDFDILNRELRSYSEALAERPQVVALNKADAVADMASLDPLAEAVRERGYEVFTLSAATGTGVQQLLYHVKDRLAELPKPSAEPEEQMLVIRPRLERKPQVVREEDGALRVVGDEVERLVVMTDLNNDDAVRRLHRQLESRGIISLLRRSGAQEGDTVRVGEAEFDFVEG